ncbi:hypothetical protein PHMEG_00016710 [Phytophthora megakarya]|uniref:Uncharacterized protein n=1 Tax=Phytophthora megakarya TaxID=4795 RepID=A0A225VYC2_9STRA|nr:hypothetical protein PHMEG_00016710 [Phytophthora megakarya]
MQQRWNTYKSWFKRTMKKHHTETGLGISRRDLARRMSIPQTLEQMCPLYSKMQVLFGERANITSSDTVELGVPSTDESKDDDAIDDLDDNTNQLDGCSECDLTVAPFAQSKMTSLVTLAPSAVDSTQEGRILKGPPTLVLRHLWMRPLPWLMLKIGLILHRCSKRLEDEAICGDLLRMHERIPQLW